MKSLLYVAVALIAICALGNSRAVTQDTSSQATAPSAGGADAFVDQPFALLREDIRSVKKQLIAANLTLSDNEAAKFWPVYDQCSNRYYQGVWRRVWLAHRPAGRQSDPSLARYGHRSIRSLSEICADLAKGIAGKEGGDLLSVGPPHRHDDRPAADFAIAPGAEPGLSANRINLSQLAERLERVMVQVDAAFPEELRLPNPPVIWFWFCGENWQTSEFRIKS